MSDTVREQIIQAFMARAVAITVANGFNTDIGANVQRALAELDANELPATVIWPQPEESERSHGRDNLTMQVRVEGLVLHGNENSSVVAEKILGDLRKCFSDPAIKAAAYGGLIEDLFYAAGGSEDYAKGGETVTGSSAVFTVRYTTLTGNPYDQ